ADIGTRSARSVDWWRIMELGTWFRSTYIPTSAIHGENRETPYESFQNPYGLADSMVWTTIDKETIVKCEYCNGEDVMTGVLEGVSFVPNQESWKFFSKGLYGVNAILCRSCGRISGLGFDPVVISKELKPR